MVKGPELMVKGPELTVKGPELMVIAWRDPRIFNGNDGKGSWTMGPWGGAEYNAVLFLIAQSGK